MNGVNLTKDEAWNVAELIDLYLFQLIRDDPDHTDNIEWLRNMIHAYEKLCDYSDYNIALRQSETNEAG